MPLGGQGGRKGEIGKGGKVGVGSGESVSERINSSQLGGFRKPSLGREICKEP